MYEMQLEVLQIIAINTGGILTGIMTGIMIGSGSYGRRRDVFFLALNVGVTGLQHDAADRQSHQANGLSNHVHF